MSRIIALQACRHGIGCSHLVANIAVILMQQGYRVGLLDTDPQAGGVRTLLGLDETKETDLESFWWLMPDYPQKKTLKASFHRYDAIGDTQKAGIYIPPLGGHFAPESPQLEVFQRRFGDIKAYEMVQNLSKALNLDFLLIDNQPEMTDDNLLSLALADIAVVMMQLETYDLQRTAVLLEVIDQLAVTKTWLVPTLVMPTIEATVVMHMLVNTYEQPVAGILYFTEELVTLASRGVFCLHFPDHPLTQTIATIAYHIEQDGKKLYASPPDDQSAEGA